MNLQGLIDENKIKEFRGATPEQIKARFNRAISYFKFAKNALGNISSDENVVIYTNLYKSARILAETFLLFHGYKVPAIQEHHKIVFQATQLLIDDSGLDKIFDRLNRMRKNRNTIDYDVESLDVSEQTLTQSISDIETLASKIRKLIK